MKAQWVFPSSATDNSHKAIAPKAGENCDVPDSQLKVLCSQLVGSGRLAIMICDGPCRTLSESSSGKEAGLLFFAEKVPGGLFLLRERTVSLLTEFSSHTLKHQLFFVTVSENTCETEMFCELRGTFLL